MFTSIHPFPGVTHITDLMGVSFTLIEGTENALLFDAGYGLENVQSYVRSVTDKPVKVLLSHGHHDHVLGARWFSETYLCAEDMEEFLIRTGSDQRSKVIKQAESQSIPVPADYLDSEIPQPWPVLFTNKTGHFDSLTEQLGNLEIQVIRVPGHTSGSIVLYIPEYRLLLTGDDWNPCTWMWFPCSLPATVWRENMLSLIRILEKNDHDTIEAVLCSHQPMLRKGSEMKNFLCYMTDNQMKTAAHIDMGAPVNTCAVRKEPEGWTLIFDRDKII